MTDLDKALGDISSIRRQMAYATEFRGYGPMTLAATGVLALSSAAVQSLWLPDPATHISKYLVLWLGTAVLSASSIGAEMFARTRRIHSGMADEMIHTAVEQFLPSALAGALIIPVLLRYVPGSLWLLPGLWQVIFGLGVFSSHRFLPRPVAAVGAWYLMTGLACIALAGNLALSPWAMGIPFGIGQLLIAGILLSTKAEQ